MSSLTWVDFDETERQRANRLLQLFSDRESRDELGLGAIRDSLADHLFPGTSTIQTRLRYMVFIPYLLRALEGGPGSAAELQTLARNRELKLIEALKAGGDEQGVIGARAGKTLQRLPSSVYWAGLASWGIRLYPGSIESYFASIPRRRAAEVGRRDPEGKDQFSTTNTWSGALPPMPEAMLESANFKLTREEGDFLRDRIATELPGSLLAWLVKNDGYSDREYIWEHPARSEFPERCQRLVKHARIFSSVIHGASLLYNLMLAELGRPGSIEGYQRSLADWAAGLDRSGAQAWELSEFWDEIAHPGHRVSSRLKRFVEDWLKLIKADEAVADSAAARALVRNREMTLKGVQSRFRNQAALRRWQGASGIDRLSFRWRNARSHLKDLSNAG